MWYMHSTVFEDQGPPRERSMLPPLQRASPSVGHNVDRSSTAPILVRSGNKLGTRSPRRPSAPSLMHLIFGRIEREVHNLTSSWSRSCHSRRIASPTDRERWARGPMVICRRWSDLAVRSAAVIHRTSGVHHQNSTSSSFVASERSSGGSDLTSPGPNVEVRY